MNPTQLFVYGSLLRGEVAHERLNPARFLGPASTVPGFMLFDLGDYPGMIEAGEGTVSGELYEIGPALLAELDEYEGHPDEFARKPILLQDGRIASSYLYRGEVRWGNPLPINDWRKRSRPLDPRTRG